MTSNNRIVILGGHGKVALLAAPKLAAAGFAVDAVIRNPEHAADVEAAGATPRILDIETASVDELAALFAGAQAVVFSAGAGGGSPERTHRVDFVAATRSIDAAKQAGVDRYVMVSYARADIDIDAIPESNSFYAYAKAKHDADAYLRASELNYTILGPGLLTLEPATGKVLIADADGEGVDAPLDDDAKVTSRDNVAAVIAHVVATGAASRTKVNFYDGETPIADAIR
ncbi:NAD(P)H-binding protein [Gulosibacter sediminis]|uniref:NAD(P)H-binding protein n=1 Tax=Gulosibacter sediminis TaxID=1729695 RepID=UPI0018693E0A|nr:NAD(P)H-binding protein [Gulosibacter sediminis]